MLSNDNSLEAFLRKPRGDKQIRLNISRNTLFAFAISLLLHAIVLFFVVPKIQLDKLKEPATFEVDLAQPEQTEVIPKQPPEPIPERPAEQLPQKKVITQKRNKSAKPPVFSVPDVLATTKPAPQKQPPETSPQAKPPETDMFAALNARRAARDQGESEAAKINAEAAAREIGPTEDEKRDAKIKQNFQNGTNGVFEITRLESRSASFTFLGWTSSLSNSRREFFEVEASQGEDVRRVMIRRMITLIRVHYQGDFDWESRRLGRTVVMSARLEDSAGLEDFLMIEFFGQNYKTAP